MSGDLLVDALQLIVDVPRDHPGLWGGEAADLMRDIARRALQQYFKVLSTGEKTAP